MKQDLRVFVIDDDSSIVKSLEVLLRANGFSVEGFTEAAPFLARSDSDGIACLLLDLRMPDLNGLEVQRALRRQGRFVPIVFLSACADVSSAAMAMRDGAVDFL